MKTMTMLLLLCLAAAPAHAMRYDQNDPESENVEDRRGESCFYAWKSGTCILCESVQQRSCELRDCRDIPPGMQTCPGK